MTNNTGKKPTRKSTPKASGTHPPRASGKASPSKAASERKARKPATLKSTPPTPKKGGAAKAQAPAAPVEVPEGDYKYDVCFSFAGENRDYVEQVARHLEKIAPGVRFFYDYDNDQIHVLWGKNLPEYFDDIYQYNSRFCVMFISKHYKDKEWTTLERGLALGRVLSNKGKEYILPAYFDSTTVKGVTRAIGHIDLRKHNALQLAQLIAQKLGYTISKSGTAQTPVAPPAAPKVGPKKQRATKPKLGAIPAASNTLAYQSRIKTSGDWMLLDDGFYLTKTVEDRGDEIVVHLTPRNTEEMARLRDLDPKRGQYRHAVSFAHGQEAAQVDVREVLTTTSAGKNALKLTLNRQPSHGASYGADETAERQARRLLLTSEQAHTRSAVSANLDPTAYGYSTFVGIGTSKAIFPPMWKRLAGQAPSIGDLLRCARLQAVLDLKAGGIVDHVLDLELGPIRAGVLQVKFRGSRRSPYGRSSSSSELAFEGACDLAGGA